MCSLTQDSGIDCRGMSQHAPAKHTSKHIAFVCIYMKETMGSSCFRGLKGHSDPSCTQSFGTITILWIPQPLYRCAPLKARLWAVTHHVTTGFTCTGSRTCIYVYLSVPGCLWPCLSEFQRLLIGRLMDWADPVACCMRPFVDGRPTAQTLRVCGALLPSTKHRGLFCFLQT